MKECKGIRFIFIRFLKENGIYNQFITNLGGKSRAKHYLAEESFAYRYVGGGFVWCRTKEGDAFWMVMDAKWKEMIFRYAPYYS